MNVVMTLTPSVVTFTFPRDGGTYPWISYIGTRRGKVRAGHISKIGTNETPSMQFVLTNVANEVSNIIGVPLRQRCVINNDDGSVFFSGLIAQMTFGPEITVTVNA